MLAHARYIRCRQLQFEFGFHRMSQVDSSIC
jgi:hypothetical protein